MVECKKNVLSKSFLKRFSRSSLDTVTENFMHVDTVAGLKYIKMYHKHKLDHFDSVHVWDVEFFISSKIRKIY